MNTMLDDDQDVNDDKDDEDYYEKKKMNEIKMKCLMKRMLYRSTQAERNKNGFKEGRSITKNEEPNNENSFLF